MCLISLPELSSGSLSQMINNTANFSSKILQIISIDTSVGPNDGYYSVIINDGLVKHNCLLNREKYLNIEQFEENSLIEVKDYIVIKKQNSSESPSTSSSTPSSTPRNCVELQIVIQVFKFLVSGQFVGRELQIEDQIIDNEEFDEVEQMDSTQINDEQNSEQTSNGFNSTLPQTPNRRRGENMSQTQTNSSPVKDFTLIKNLSANDRYKKYQLKGKIIDVFPIEKWNNIEKHLEGTKMSFLFSDNHDIIRCTAWNNACEEIKPTVVPGHYVRITGATVAVNPSGVNTISLNTGSVVTPDPIKIKYKQFVDFANLGAFIGQKVDVIGIIDNHIPSKQSKRKNFRLKDKNGYVISVTLQNKTAEHFGGSKGSVLAIKNAFVVNQNSIKAINFNETKCIIDPQTPDASLLK